MHTSQLQSIVYESVKRRGYVNGYAPDVFAARQVAKLAEELGEFAACFAGLPPFVALEVQQAATTARGNFDYPALWGGAHITDVEKAAKELADIAVVLLCAAEALGCDVLSMALDKARSDEVRGVRNA